MKLSKSSIDVITEALIEKELSLTFKIKRIKAANNIIEMEYIPLLERELEVTKEILVELQKGTE